MNRGTAKMACRSKHHPVKPAARTLKDHSRGLLAYPARHIRILFRCGELDMRVLYLTSIVKTTETHEEPIQSWSRAPRVFATQAERVSGLPLARSRLPALPRREAKATGLDNPRLAAT